MGIQKRQVVAFGKTIEEVENEIKQTTTETKKEENVQNKKVSKANKSADDKKEDEDMNEKVKEEAENNGKSKEGKSKEGKSEEEEVVEEKKKELAFSFPVEGEIIREYAKDNLVYSDTLKEWVTHTGIDIKADKTTVVKAVEDGTVTAIKNDPRYGTTVIIEHQDGFESRYANLLTAEFVTIGEKVTKGQTIGTVGNTAAFEVMDDYHLHFELLKDGEYQNPQNYLT